MSECGAKRKLSSSMCRVSKRKLDSTDRISQLPELIQHSILSLLHPRAVARTACLSKEWRGIVKSRPVLAFNENYFPVPFKPHNDPLFFINLINNSIQNVLGQGLSIQKFSLKAEVSDSWESSLDSWIQQLVEAGVKDLTFLLGCVSQTTTLCYYLPPIVFLSETITHLRLSYCDLEDCDDVSLPNLVELSLQEVTLSQDMIQKISSGCPSLETLKLNRCYDLPTSVCISGLPRLDKVELSLHPEETEVKIDAARLRVLQIRYEDWPKIELLACQTTLKKLKLYVRENELRSCPNAVTTEELESLLSNFVGLEVLKLSHLCLTSIRIPNQKLVKVEVSCCRKLERVEIGTPNLPFLKYRFNKPPFHHTFGINHQYSSHNSQ